MLSTLQHRNIELSRPDCVQKPLMCAPLRDYTKENERVRSFINWPNKEISPETLAKAGFYYYGTKDIVRCAFCSIEGHQWKRSDDPMADHSRWRPDCNFVKKMQRNGESEDSGHDTCGNRIEIFPNSVADDELLVKLGANKTRGPRHKEMALVDNRLGTFANWPKSMHQKPADLADAGFFYRGTGDQTLCFHCGGGLNDWEQSDEPWEQHALWFPKCNYLLMKKGREYVQAVQERWEASLEAPSASTSNTKELVKSEGNDVVRRIAMVPSETSSGVSSVVASEDESKSTASSSAPSSLESLEDKSKSTVEDSRLCKICFRNEMSILFLPCSHICACVECAAVLNQCAICRGDVQATVRAFLS